MNRPTRDKAITLWRQYNSDISLYRHALSVEAVMRHFSLKFEGDPVEWGIIGLIHDIDYEKWPDSHLKKIRELLLPEGFPEEWIRAAESHGFGIINDVEPITNLEKTLYTIDELTGFIAACAMVRPSKSVLDLEVRSVKKKWGEKAFAAGVRRDLIEKGASMISMSLDEVIRETIAGMRTVSGEINLKGNM